jgi:aspartyl-tRNA(Asn)/glutamyl-tRNA(Gln) amidotransferase subunit B
MNYEPVIGLEVHVELSTDTKIFCGCSTAFGAEPNANTCPICLGMPGVLPVLNKKVLEYAIKVGLALNCEIASFSKFDRKNYFYPDLPKDYQISQYDLPICKNGYVDIVVDGVSRRVRINRVHMEEDAGKLLHSEGGRNESFVDFNRTGVPLLEIVTEPDIRSAEEARVYLEKLKAILQYIGVSDVKMEEGSLRCDANVSVRPSGSSQFGTKTEIKNMNSFKAVQKGIEYEIERQIEALEDGETIIQETRRWDENKGITFSMRSKEEAHDYRYFPDPDLVPIVVDPVWVEEIKAGLPELPDERKRRLIEKDGLPEYDAAVITASKAMADFYDQAVSRYHNPKIVSNWIMGDFSYLLKEHNQEIEESKVTPENLVEMLELMDKGVISGKIAKTVFEEMFLTGKKAKTIVEEKGLVQISDTAALEGIVDKVIANNPKSVEDYQNGKGKALGFLVGQVMKETRGKANPQIVNELIVKKLQQ